ncbi:hypothetical protein Tco_1152232 [Tanacetum coccineum]
MMLTSSMFKESSSRKDYVSGKVVYIPFCAGLEKLLLHHLHCSEKSPILLEDKKILSVGVFDEEVFGGNTRDLGSFGEETDKTTDLHQHCSRISLQWLETASQIQREAVTTMIKTASQGSRTASEHTTQSII